MSMPISDANDLNTVLLWCMGKPRYGHRPVTDQEATDAARRITVKAYKALSAGLHPEQVQLTRTVSDASIAGDPACRVCGCTENDPCPGGCMWVADPKMLGELCSSCAVLLKQAGLL